MVWADFHSGDLMVNVPICLAVGTSVLLHTERTVPGRGELTKAPDAGNDNAGSQRKLVQQLFLGGPVRPENAGACGGQVGS